MSARPGGFTLVELLIVIAIIAVLSAIVFPVYSRVREKARQNACVSNERQIGIAMLQYAQDYDEHVPNGNTANVHSWFWAGEGWAGQCSAYLGSRDIFVCPDDPTVPAMPADYVVSYGYNSNLVDGVDGQVTAPPPPGVVLSKLYSPTRTVMLFEVSGVTANISDSQEGAEPGGLSGQYYSASACGLDNRLYAHKTNDTGTDNLYATGLFAGRQPSSPSQFDPASGRHSNGANYVFADGHAKWMLGSMISSGINAPGPTCNQDNSPALPSCTISGGTLTAAGSASTNSSATFSIL